MKRSATRAELGKLVKKEDWNELKIVAAGNKTQHYINGQLMSELTDNQADKRRLSGLLALQLHAGPPMKIEFKNIRLKRNKLAKVEGLGERRKIVMLAGRPESRARRSRVQRRLLVAQEMPRRINA